MGEVIKKCSGCELAHPLALFYADKTKRDGRHTICIPCTLQRASERRVAETAEQRAERRVYAREYYHRSGRREATIARRKGRRDVLVERYGGQCECCGETASEFLTFDHVGGWGAEHRASGDPYASTAVEYLWRWGEGRHPGFRLLCFNCNCSLGIYGHCPHQSAAEVA